MRSIPLRSWLMGLLIALPLGYAYLFPEILHCQTIRFSADFKPLPGLPMPVYVSRHTSLPDQQRLKNHILSSTTRLKTFWQVPLKATLQGTATIIYCSDPDLFIRYCGQNQAESSAGCSLGTPWGEAFLILGPDGNNPDVIAHERCHDELLARLGWWTIQRQIPQWFNEGLALMVDYRFVPANTNSLERFRELHDEWQFRGQSGQEVFDLQQLESTHDFFNGNTYHVMLAYLASATEVSRWLTVAGSNGLIDLTKRLNSGASFQDAYSKLGNMKRNKNPYK